MKSFFLVISILFISLQSSIAQQAGTLDLSFGDNGVVTTDISPEIVNAIVTSIQVQPDGKVVATGWYRPYGSLNDYRGIVICRYNSNGELDQSFGNNGITRIPNYEMGSGSIHPTITTSVLTSSNQTICVGDFSSISSSGILIVKLDDSGHLDSTFGNNGIILDNIGLEYPNVKKVVQVDGGKLLIAGNSGQVSFISRFMSDGTIDPSFGINGMVSVEPYIENIGVDLFGRITLSGSYVHDWRGIIGVTRLLANGVLDMSFGTNGLAYFDLSETQDIEDALARLRSLHVFPNGDMLVGGGWYNTIEENTEYCMIKIKRTGHLDSSFSNNGQLKFNPSEDFEAVQAILVQVDGKIVAVGETLDSGNQLFRLNTDGSFDTSFGVNGMFSFPFREAQSDQSTCGTIQPDLKILVGGGSRNPEQEYEGDFAIARILTDLNIGILEFSETLSNTLLYPNPIQEQATFQYELAESEELSISLFDMQGKHIKTFLTETEQQAGKHQLELDFPKDLQSGTYLLSISSEKGQMGIRVIKR